MDIDECTDGSHECLHSDCENSDGSYVCNCHEGTELIDNQPFA